MTYMVDTTMPMTPISSMYKETNPKDDSAAPGSGPMTPTTDTGWESVSMTSVYSNVSSTENRSSYMGSSITLDVMMDLSGPRTVAFMVMPSV